MTNTEIKAMIEHYDIVRVGDNIGIRKNIPEAKKNVDDIRAAKPHIVAYFKAEESRRADEARKKEETFNSIPGVRELLAAADERENYNYDFQRCMDEGNGRLPAKPKSSIKELKERYPDAAFAIQVMDEYQLGHNYELISIAKRAYEALRDGQAVAEVRTSYEKEKDEWLHRHAWD